MPITNDECVLIPEARRKGLVDQFNQISESLETLRKATKGVENFTEDIHDFETRLENIRVKITRKYYRVGFLGTTQAGKSTTFNNILNVKRPDAPAQPGAGYATTAAPSRLRRCEPNQQGLVLNFMSSDDYDRRKRRLTEHLRMGVLLTENELIEECAKIRARHGRGEHTLAPNATINDVIALESLLLSKRQYPNLVNPGKDRLTRPANYEDRDRYLNHPLHPMGNNNATLPEPNETENHLLWEIEIHFANNVVPPTIEMLDLPGLGTRKYHDTCVTLDIIENTGPDCLDAALIFIRSNQLSNENVIFILETLQRTWQKQFRGRVWVIFTQFDALTEYHFNQTNNNFFSEVNNLGETFNIPNDCIFFISNIIYNHIQSELAKNNNFTDEQKKEVARLATQTGYSLNSDFYTNILRNYPQFQESTNQLYLNGGIDHLRSAIVERLSGMIGTELADDAQNMANSLKRDIEYRIEVVNRRQNQNNQVGENAN
jgi:hypothetical protein